MDTITLYRTSNGWFARYTDPQIIAAFGTSDVPTAFTTNAEPPVVLREVRRSNPDCRVIMADSRLAISR